MNLSEQVLKTWASCQSKIKQLKTNDQTRLALLLTPAKLVELEREINTKQAQVEQMRNRAGEKLELLSWEDYKKYHHLQQETRDLSKKLADQKEIRDFDWDRFLHDRQYILVLNREKNEYLQELKMANEKLDKVKELLKTQQFTELLTLAQQKRI